ncbi:MAG: hypothetical protein ACHQ5A_07450 [Opitutales bacterium]
MISTMGELELQVIDVMDQQQLLVALGPRRAGLPPDLRDGLEDQPTDWLRMLLLAARLLDALRLLQGRPRIEGSP